MVFVRNRNLVSAFRTDILACANSIRMRLLQHLTHANCRSCWKSRENTIETIAFVATPPDTFCSTSATCNISEIGNLEALGAVLDIAIPRSTRNSGAAGHTAPTSTPASIPRRRVSFTEEQGNTVATAAQKKAAKAQERARARAEKQQLEEEQAAAKRAEREAERQDARRRREEEEATRRAEREAERQEARRRKEEEGSYKEMEKELYRLRR